MENVADLIHIIVTVASFVCFVLIGLWAYSKSAKPHFEEAANLPFAEEDDHGPAEDRRAIAETKASK